VLPKYAGAKSWSAFMPPNGQSTRITGTTDIVPYRKDPEGRGWVADKKHKTQFPAGTTRDQVIERMIKIIQAAAKSE